MYLEDLGECVECGQLCPTEGDDGGSWSVQDFQYFAFGDGDYLLCGDCVADVRDIGYDLGYVMCDWCGSWGAEEDLDEGDNGLLACGACDAVFDDEDLS